MCFVPICFVSRTRSKWLLLLCIRLLLLPSAAICRSLPWSKRPHDQSLGSGLTKMWLVVALACSQNKWYSDPKDTSIGARLCVGCALSGGLGVTRVAFNRRIDAGRLMAHSSRRPLVTAVCHNLGYPVCIIGSSGCGVFSPWFVMPCYTHVCYSVLCHGQVHTW